jgi:multicomponent Na+:H+ antiporter subunit C
MELLGYYNYWVFAILLVIGLYAVIAKGNLIKKLLGLAIFQSAVFLMYITMNKVAGGTSASIDSYRYCCWRINYRRGPCDCCSH